METGYDIQQIFRMLPHRFPFLLVDRVLRIDDGPNTANRLGRKAVAIKNVTVNEHHFAGHFPERPIMPGVLLVEAMAQVGGLAYRRENDGHMSVVIAAIRSAKFREPVVPGDQVLITAEILRDGGQMIVVGAKAEVGGRVVAESEILAKISFHTTPQ